MTHSNETESRGTHSTEASFLTHDRKSAYGLQTVVLVRIKTTLTHATSHLQGFMNRSWTNHCLLTLRKVSDLPQRHVPNPLFVVSRLQYGWMPATASHEISSAQPGTATVAERLTRQIAALTTTGFR